MLRKFGFSLLIGLFVAILLSLLFFLGLFETWQNKLSDSLFTPKAPRDDIVIIAIDDKSIQSIGRWPWDRSIHARLLNTLSEAKPASVGFDVSFFEASDPLADSLLSESIKNLGNVTLAAEEVDGSIFLPILTLSQNSSLGVVNTTADSDGITRKARLRFNGLYDHFIISVLSWYTGEVNPKLDDEFLRINFVGKPKTFTTYSYIDVLEKRVDSQVFKDKIVLIGATAPDLHDSQLVPTSYGTPMSGVEIHANSIQTILDGKYLVNQPKFLTILNIFGLSLVASIIFLFLPITGLAIAFTLIVVSFIGYAVLSFDNGLIVNVTYPLLSVLLVFIASIVYKYFSEFNQKRFIKKAFSYYLSEQVLKEILANPSKLKLGGERKKLTVLFSDIVSFTSFSEKTAPEKLAGLLNDYLTRMTNIVFKYNGVLDKYIGDAVMAFWGAPISDPKHPLHACSAAIEMLQANKDSAFETRIGINSGEMIVGNMGSRQRFDYTLLGDNVNLGSRLEGINKLYGTNIIISEATYEEVKNKVVARKLDRVAVKGKAKAITIYELRAMGNPTQKVSVFLEEFEKARGLYESGKFKEAVQAFKNFAKKYPKDKPTKQYLERCKKLLKARPLNWDGVYHAESK